MRKVAALSRKASFQFEVGKIQEKRAEYTARKNWANWAITREGTTKTIKTLGTRLKVEEKLAKYFINLTGKE